jgi:hypothetical protein
MKLKRILPLLIAAFLLPVIMNAQVTTSSITGVVKSDKGEALEGATVKAIHTPSGTVYTTVSRNGGDFTIPNMRVGGPYTVQVTFVGYQTQEYKDLDLQLGEATKLTPTLISSAQSLADVNVVLRKNTLISKDLTGTSLSVTRNEMDLLPTITRNINDFARLSPIAQVRSSNTDGSPMGISFGGQSTRYNQFAIDGANSTDVFGLSSNGTNGGQAGINPIPFDAISQLQVILAPYDVTQGGFTGGGMNAVTRSGTNTLHGSAYGYYQDQSMVGKSITTNSKYPKFSNYQYGARLGGAIIKSKLFYFVNYEGLSRTQPIANQPGGPDGISQIDVATAKTLGDYVKKTYGYDPGSINGINTTRKSNSVFARIDWNINDKTKLMVRDNYVNGNNYIISDSKSTMVFGNGGYNFTTKTNSFVAELNSNISNRESNLLRFTYTSIRDKRDVGSPFPSVTISDNGATYKLGNEYSSQANSLNQNITTLTDNFNIYAGKHTITLGTDNLIYTTKNVFLQGVNGDYTYRNLDGFYNDSAMSQYQTTYSRDPKNPLGAASIKMGQFSLYAQDAYNIEDNFKLTYGLRADMPVFFNNPVSNDAFNGSDIAIANGVNNSKPPKSKILLSPRVGFNWDVHHNAQTQVRGGVGVFTGRVPMVWVSNQYSNTGVATIKYTAKAADIAANNITFNPGHPYQGTPTTTPPSEVDVTDRNFEAPRTLRANLALDQKLPWGLVATIEGVYTKTIKDIKYQDINLAPASLTLDLGNGVTRPFYNAVKNNPNYTNVLLLGNTNKGYSYNVYVRLQKPFIKGWTASVAYSLGHSYGLNDGTSSTALSNYRFAYNINGLNNLDLARNNNDQGSRVTLMLAKKFTYGKFASNLGLFYTGQSGQTLTYVFFGDLNGDDGSTVTRYSTAGGADIMFLPTSAANFKASGGLTPDEEFAAFQTYVNSDPYLKSHVGKNLARNGSRLPWENHVDFKFAEEYSIVGSHKITLSVDILNVGHLISKDWGKAYYASNQELQPLDVAGFNQTDNTVTPLYTFSPNFGSDKYTNKPWSYSDYLSRWSMQIGLRYSF